VRPLKAWPFIPTAMGIEVILFVAAALAPESDMALRVEIFVIFVSLALGRVSGITVDTTYHRDDYRLDLHGG